MAHQTKSEDNGNTIPELMDTLQAYLKQSPLEQQTIMSEEKLTTAAHNLDKLNSFVYDENTGLLLLESGQDKSYHQKDDNHHVNDANTELLLLDKPSHQKEDDTYEKIQEPLQQFLVGVEYDDLYNKNDIPEDTEKSTTMEYNLTKKTNPKDTKNIIKPRKMKAKKKNYSTPKARHILKKSCVGHNCPQNFMENGLENYNEENFEMESGSTKCYKCGSYLRYRVTPDLFTKKYFKRGSERCEIPRWYSSGQLSKILNDNDDLEYE